MMMSMTSMTAALETWQERVQVKDAIIVMKDVSYVKNDVSYVMTRITGR